MAIEFYTISYTITYIKIFGHKKKSSTEVMLPPPVASWHRMETGARVISSALLPQLAEALSLTTEELAAALPVVDVGTHDQD